MDFKTFKEKLLLRKKYMAMLDNAISSKDQFELMDKIKIIEREISGRPNISHLQFDGRLATFFQISKDDFAKIILPICSKCKQKVSYYKEEKFGIIKDVTDKGYYTNSYHVDVREKIDAFDKFKFESQFQTISSGGAISYVEIPNMRHNLEALETMVKFIYENIQYAEFNTKSDYCHVCGFDGEITINDDLEWECPNCGNKDHSKMNVTRRTCGYLGENFWNVGKTKEINSRVLHI